MYGRKLINSTKVKDAFCLSEPLNQQKGTLTETQVNFVSSRFAQPRRVGDVDVQYYSHSGIASAARLFRPPECTQYDVRPGLAISHVTPASPKPVRQVTSSDQAAGTTRRPSKPTHFNSPTSSLSRCPSGPLRFGEFWRRFSCENIVA
jgi:hypothetical protein